MAAPKEVQQWYRDHDVPYIPTDWGRRAETGEGLSDDINWEERPDIVRSADPTPVRMWWWERQTFPWQPRTAAESSMIDALEEFFWPYLAELGVDEGFMLHRYLFDRATYQEIADDLGSTRQNVHRRVKTAIRTVTRRVAQQNPDFVAESDGRRRNFEDEVEAARAMLNDYLERREVTHDG
mgnify:FL=1